MEQIQISKHGAPNVLSVINKPSHSLGKNEIRIQVSACGVNFADLMMRMGLYPEAPKPPFTPGYEIAGTIIEKGANVTSFNIDDRVFAFTKFGGYTSEAVIDYTQVKIIPTHLSFEQAACIPVNFSTAWVALHNMARIKENDRVLIQSAAGGVGIAAIQLALQAKAKVFATVGSQEKVNYLNQYPLEKVLTYSEWKNEPRETSFDIILDSFGGSSLKQAFSHLSPTGRVVNYGISQITNSNKRSIINTLKTFSQTPFFTPFKLMMQNKGIFGLNMLTLSENPQLLSSIMDEICLMFENKKLNTHISKSFDFENAADAHQFLHDRKNIGKVILTKTIN